MSVVAALFAVLGFQLGGPVALPHAGRASGVAMAYSLNNFPLPGPITPVSNLVLIKLSKADESTKGGLFLATEEVEKPREGIVVAVGAGRVHPDTGVVIPTGLAVGDLVMLREFTGEQVEYCGQAHQFMSSDSVLGAFAGGVSDSAKDFRPLSDNLLVKISQAATSTSSGIALAVGDTEVTPRGEVVQVGPGRTTSMGGVAAMDVAIGDSVLFQPYAGSDVNLGGTKYKVVRASDCLAKW